MRTCLLAAAIALGACTIPPPTMMAPLDDAAPAQAGTVSVIGHVGGAIVPDEDPSPTVAAGGDVELAVGDGASVALSGGVQNQGVLGQVSVRIRTGGVEDKGWVGQLSMGLGYAVLTDTAWFNATPAVGAHIGLTASAPVGDTGRGFIGAALNLSQGLDSDRVIAPFTYIGGGAVWELPAGRNSRILIGIQAYGLGIIIPVSPGLVGQLGARFGRFDR
jgi:hypothetical protein